MTPSGPPLEDLVKPLLSATRHAVAVGAIRDSEQFVLCQGPVTAETRFEIGSLTKTFTALLLAEMVARGEVDYNDSINEYLPYSIAGPPVTLLHLATHTAGLPRLPPGLLRKSIGKWFSNPYEKFSSDNLMDSLDRTRKRFPPGTRSYYSNFGVALLGETLGYAAGTSYLALLAERVLGPLGMTDTDGDPHRAQVTGYWHDRARPSWLIPGLPAAGALRSSIRDMLGYLTAYLEPGTVSSPTLRSALIDIQRPQLVLPGGEGERYLIWNRRDRPYPRLLLHHSGGTRGFTAFAAFSREPATALVAFTNTSPTLRGGFIQTAYETVLAFSKFSSVNAGV